MGDKGFRDIWLRERSQRFAAWTATIAILLSILPVLLRIGPAELGTALPLVVLAVFLTFLGASYSYRLGWIVVVAVALPILASQGEDRWDAVRNALFVSVGAVALAWAHRQQRLRLQQRARIRRKLVGRVKSRARELQQTGSELRMAVERSETAHRTLLEHLPVHVLQKDLDGRFVFVSQSFSQLLGQTVDDVLGKTDYDFYEVGIADKFRKDDLRVVRDGLIVDDVERTQQPNGTIAFMQVRKAPLRDASGTIIGVQGIFWDVTETLSGRLQLQRIESWAHALIQAALDAVLIVDIDGRVLEVNPAVATILGYQQQGGEHPPLGDIMRLAASDLATTDSGIIPLRDADEVKLPAGDPGLLNRLLQRATGRRIEVSLKRPDDSWFDAEISAHPLVVENSSGWAIFIRDITRRKKSVTELQLAKEAAERANLAKSEFVANVSHELRTPLTGIVGLHELLERSVLDDQQREYLTLARTSSDNLLALIDALLDFSKIEAHRLQLENEPFNLVECVESSANSLAARAQLRGLELVINCDPQLPKEVVGDGGRVRQILLNLIGNAVKFTERGDIQVRVLCEAAQQPSLAVGAVWERQWIRFDVIDAGIGIAEETQAVIFEAFRQADSSTTRRYGGTGLGLAICRELVHLMGGTISVASVPQRGSTFSFRLPLQILQPPVGADSPTPAVRHQIALAAAPSLWRDVLLRDLRALGHEVTCLEVNELLAREPKSLFVAGNHTLIIADYRELVSCQPTSLPVVARVILAVPMAFARPAHTPAWLRHGEVRWLPRPISRSELTRALSDEELVRLGNVTDEAGNGLATRSGDILLVEDSPINQTVLEGILEQLGHSVTLARNGAEAVQRCEEHEFDVVLMDIQMPEVDGLEATRRIRAREGELGRSQTHIIALTAHAMPSDREQSRAAGMNGFLVKPIPMESLRRALANVPQLSIAVGEADRSVDATTLLNRTKATIQVELNRVNLEQWRDIDQMMGGNSQLAGEIVSLLRTEAVRLWQDLQASVSLRQAREVRRAAHTLKSNLRNVVLNDTADLFGRCESFAQKEQWEDILSLLALMSESIEMLVHWCDRMQQVRS